MLSYRIIQNSRYYKCISAAFEQGTVCTMQKQIIFYPSHFSSHPYERLFPIVSGKKKKKAQNKTANKIAHLQGCFIFTSAKALSSFIKPYPWIQAIQVNWDNSPENQNKFKILNSYVISVSFTCLYLLY